MDRDNRHRRWPHLWYICKESRLYLTIFFDPIQSFGWAENAFQLSFISLVHPCYSVCIPQEFTDVCHVFVWLSQTHILYILIAVVSYISLVLIPFLLLFSYSTRVYRCIFQFLSARKQLAISDSLHMLKKKSFSQLHCVTPHNREPSIACMRWTNVGGQMWKTALWTETLVQSVSVHFNIDVIKMC